MISPNCLVIVIVSFSLFIGPVRNALGADNGSSCELVPQAYFSPQNDGNVLNSEALYSGTDSRHVEFSANVLPVSEKISLAMWVQPSESDHAEARFISQATGEQSSEHWLMVGTGQERSLRFRLKTDEGIAHTLVSEPGQLEVGVWTYLVFTYDNTVMRIYKNGDLLSEKPVVGRIAHNLDVPVGLGDQPLGAGSRKFSGSINGLHIFDEAVSAQAIKNQFSCSTDITSGESNSVLAPTDDSNTQNFACPVSSGLLSHFNFDDEPTNPADRLTAAYGVGVGVVQAVGISGSALDPNGGVVTLPNSLDHNFENALSFSLWIKPKSYESVEGRFVSKASGVLNQEHSLMFGVIDKDALRFRLRIDNQTHTLISPAGQFEIGSWTLVTATYDGEHMRIYSNDNLVAISNVVGQISFDSDHKLAIGNQPKGAGDRAFSGLIDDLRVYGRAISQTEIGEIFTTRGSCGEIQNFTTPVAVEVVQPVEVAIPLEAEVPTSSETPVEFEVPVEVPESQDIADNFTVALHVKAPDLSADYIREKLLRLRWTGGLAVGAEITSYEIMKNADSSDLITVYDTRYFLDTDIESGRNYNYSIRLVTNNDERSNWSNSVSVDTPPVASETTLEPPLSELANTTPELDLLPPDNVSGLTGSVVDMRNVSLSWVAAKDNGSDSVVGYRVMRGSQLVADLLSVSSFLDIDVPLGEEIIYKVMSVDQSGNVSSGVSVNVIVPEVVSAPVKQVMPEDLFEAPELLYGFPATSVNLGDIDGDGDLDMTIVDGQRYHDEGAVLAWFEAPNWNKRQIGTPLQPFTGDSKLADMDSDGDLDFVVSVDAHQYDDTQGYLYWYENTGSFDADWHRHTIEANIPNAVHIGELITGDIDGDGRMDVAIRHLSKMRIVLYFQDENGGWFVRRIDTVHREGLALHDLDSDGKLDIIANGFILFAPDNPRTGGWTRANFDSKFYTSPQQRLNNSTKANAHDFNGDGRLDIVVSSAEGEAVYLAWYEAPLDPRKQAWTKHIIESPQAGNHQVLVADFDLDGDADIAGGFAFGGKGVYWWENEGSNSNVFGKHALNAELGCYSCVAADIDNDGDIDIVGPTKFEGPVYLYRNNASGD